VPVLRLGLTGKQFSEQQLNDFALNFVRTQLVTVPGASVPYPYGGKQKYIEINLNYQALQARGITPADVVNAVNAQNLILPSGTAKISQFEYQVGSVVRGRYMSASRWHPTYPSIIAQRAKADH
jgi:multidrug efflux pump subunit AcrB